MRKLVCTASVWLGLVVGLFLVIGIAAALAILIPELLKLLLSESSLTYVAIAIFGLVVMTFVFLVAKEVWHIADGICDDLREWQRKRRRA